MEIGLTVKPVSAAQAPLSMRTAVATELAPSQAVTVATESTAAAGYQAARDTLDAQRVSREVLIDPQTREVIFRVIATRTGRVISQEPEEAMLKLEAYNRAELKRDADAHVIERTI